VVEHEDLKILHQRQNDEEVMRLARSYPDHTTSMAALEVKLEKILKGEEPRHREYIIEEKGARSRSGGRASRFMDGPARESRIRRTSASRLARKGYGTEVVQLLLIEAFEQLNLRRVAWWTFAENAASLGLARKMGFKEECRVRDSVFFDNRYHDSVGLGLLKTEYEPARRLSANPKRSA
jgi:RimJ/RimL family protein N-acetyltransferase